MPVLKNENSPTVALPEVAHASGYWPTQDSLAQGGNEQWETYAAQEAVVNVSADDILTWQIPPSTSMTDIGESFIKITGHFLVSAGVNFTDTNTANSTLAPVPFLSAALFNDVTLEVNGVSVVPSQGIAQPYAVVMNVIKNEGFAERADGDLTKGYELDRS